jgi:hypothetical protein
MVQQRVRTYGGRLFELDFHEQGQFVTAVDDMDAVYVADWFRTHRFAHLTGRVPLG